MAANKATTSLEVVALSITQNQCIEMRQIFAFCLIAAFLLPYQTFPYLTFFHDWLTFLAIAILLASLADKKSAIKLPCLTLIPLGLSVIIILQICFKKISYTSDGIIAMLYLLVSALAIIIGATLESNHKDESKNLFNTIGLVFIISGLVSTSLASLQFFGYEKFFYPFIASMSHSSSSIRPYANLAQPNQLALVFTLSIASIWRLFQQKSINGFIATISTIALLWGLTLAQSRTGFVIILSFFLMHYLWKRSAKLAPIHNAIPILLIFILIGFISVRPYLEQLTYALPQATTRLASSSSLYVRLIFLAQALQISLENFWFGAGWSEFGHYQIKIAQNFPAVPYTQHAHNIIINLAAELGWPVTIFFSVSFSYWVYKTSYLPSKNATIDTDNGFAILILVAVTIHSLLEYPLWYGYILIPTSLILGVLHQKTFTNPSVFLPQPAILMTFLVYTAILLGVAKDYRQLIINFRASAMESFNLKADSGLITRPQWTVFHPFYDLFELTKFNALKTLKDDKQLVEKVVNRFGYPHIMLRAAHFYTLYGNTPKAVEILRTFNKLHQQKSLNAYQAWELMAQSSDNYRQVLEKIDFLKITPD